MERLLATMMAEAGCVAPLVVRVRFCDGLEGEANLKPCIFEWDAAHVPRFPSAGNDEAPDPL